MPVKMWKSLAILILCSVNRLLCLPDEIQELINTLHQSCVEETAVPEESIENARKGNFADDGKLGCYMKCLLDQMGCIDDNGIIDVEATIAVIPEEYQEKGDRIVRACGTKIGKDACDNALLTNKCWYQQSPNDYFLA